MVEGADAKKAKNNESVSRGKGEVKHAAKPDESTVEVGGEEEFEELD